VAIALSSSSRARLAWTRDFRGVWRRVQTLNLGEKDRAIEQIAAVERIPNTLSHGLLKLHPYWDSLRGDPRFENIVASLAPKKQ
jgi:hypothetical protein